MRNPLAQAWTCVTCGAEEQREEAPAGWALVIVFPDLQTLHCSECWKPRQRTPDALAKNLPWRRNRDNRELHPDEVTNMDCIEDSTGDHVICFGHDYDDYGSADIATIDAILDLVNDKRNP